MFKGKVVVGIGFLDAFGIAVGCLVVRRKSLEADRVKDARMSVGFILQK